MQVRNLERDAEPFITADGSTIREILNVIHPPTAQQSLAEASLPAGGSTVRHHHRVAEEIYFILAGTATMELDAPLLLRAALPARGHLLRLSGRRRCSAHALFGVRM
jgi:hypothetical protein